MEEVYVNANLRGAFVGKKWQVAERLGRDRAWNEIEYVQQLCCFSILSLPSCHTLAAVFIMLDFGDKPRCRLCVSIRKVSGNTMQAFKCLRWFHDMTTAVAQLWVLTCLDILIARNAYTRISRCWSPPSSANMKLWLGIFKDCGSREYCQTASVRTYEVYIYITDSRMIKSEREKHAYTISTKAALL